MVNAGIGFPPHVAGTRLPPHGEIPTALLPCVLRCYLRSAFIRVIRPCPRSPLLACHRPRSDTKIRDGVRLPKGESPILPTARSGRLQKFYRRATQR